MQLPVIGDVIAGKYRVDEVLGEGGFGCVYRGVDENSERPVAIKVLKPTQQGYPMARAQRFLREMRAIAKLQSPYTLTLYDVGQTPDGLLFMITELVEGQDLTQVLATRGTLTEREAAHVVMQVLLSLTEAHTAGILHRDIKPSNIRIFEYDDDPLRVKLLDFGLAQSLDTDEVRLTGTGNIVGTPRYMAPEHLIGEELTPAADIYSLGVVARECVLGRSAVSSKVSRQLEKTDAVSPVFREIVNAMLEPDWDGRPQSAREVYELFRSRRHELGRVPVPAPPRERAQEAVERQTTTRREARPDDETLARPKWVRVLGVAALVVAVGLLVREQLDTPPSTEAPPVVPAALVITRPPRPDAGPGPSPQPPPATQAAPDTGDLPGCPDFDGVTGHLDIEVATDVLSAPEIAHMYVPKSYNPDKRSPLVIAFRDFRSRAKSVIRRSRLNRFAERDGYVIVAPTEVGTLAGVWESPEDIERAVRALNEAKRRYCIDDSRVFAYGHGMGGRGVTRLICDVPGITAAATTSFRPAIQDKLPCEYAGRVARLSFDPQKNPRAPKNGGAGCGIVAAVISTKAYEERLRAQAGCTEESETWFEHEYGECKRWTCNGPERITCRVDGGREFFGTRPRRVGAIDDSGCEGTPVDFPYSAQIFRFFDEVAADR